MARKSKDITGNIYNRIIALKYSHTKQYSTCKREYWLFRCFCGKEFVTTKADITIGRIKSCGCTRYTTRHFFYNTDNFKSRFYDDVCNEND